jgi:hypothetical protein
VISRDGGGRRPGPTFPAWAEYAAGLVVAVAVVVASAFTAGVVAHVLWIVGRFGWGLA